MAWKFTPDRAVYIQIADRVRKAVLSGEYRAGEQLPTVRQLAMDAAVNPNTVQRAYTELEDEGIIVVQGTLGRFVTEDLEVIRHIRERLAREITGAFLEEMSRLSIAPEQVISLIKEVKV